MAGFALMADGHTRPPRRDDEIPAGRAWPSAQPPSAIRAKAPPSAIRTAESDPPHARLTSGREPSHKAVNHAHPSPYLSHSRTRHWGCMKRTLSVLILVVTTLSLSAQTVEVAPTTPVTREVRRSEEHTSELQSHSDIVCRL